MSRVIYICLGSDYSNTLEHELAFIKELHEKNHEVSIYSIDKKELPPEPNNDGFLTRISMDLNEDNIEELVTEIIVKESGEEVSQLIVMDGIDFKGIKFGNIIKEKMERYYQKENQNISVTVFHLITPQYENPVFNNQFINNAFAFKEFFHSIQNDLSALANNTEKKHLLKIIQQISGQRENHFNQITIFLQSSGFLRIFNPNQETAKALIVDKLIKYFCNQITLEKINNNEALDDVEHLKI